MKLKKTFLTFAVICGILCLAGCEEEYEAEYGNVAEAEADANDSSVSELTTEFSENVEEQNTDVPTTSEQEEAVDEVDYANGECGENLHWALSVDGVLTISGYGEMGWYYSAPWDDYRDRITSVVIKEGVTSIASDGFLRCENLKSISLPESLTEIGKGAFQYCTSLESIDLPDAIEELPDQAFSGCTNLKSITLPDELEMILDYVFSECENLQEITLPPKVWWVGNYAFQGCSGLEYAYLPDTVSVIGCDAFVFCSSLKSITIPAQVDILSNVFFKCVSLNEVYFEGDAPQITDRTFMDVDATCYYPSGNSTWTISKMSDYGGNLIWVAK